MVIAVNPRAAGRNSGTVEPFFTAEAGDPVQAASTSSRQARLEMRDVTVAHGVFLALKSQLAGSLDRCLGLVLSQLFERVDLRLDEAALNVGMNGARSLQRRRTDGDRPG